MSIPIQVFIPNGSWRKKKQEWEKLFPCEPYEITDYAKVELDIKYEQKSEYNLVAAAERQRGFYYDVSLPHYWNKAFQTRAIERYGSWALVYLSIHTKRKRK